ncbi:MAG: hypothetical protein FJ265_19400 [Planctomycetes bacterium]|nr:hypothetical protein [Planctomycetota bacterium]
MRRVLLAVLSLSLSLVLPNALRAQVTREQFRAEFNKAFELGDQKMMDQAMRKDRAATLAATYFEELCVDLVAGRKEVAPKVEAMRASWGRCFEKSGTLDRLQRWVEGTQASTYDSVQRGRENAAKTWNFYTTTKDANREEVLKVMRNFATLGQTAEQFGHYFEAAENYCLAIVVGSKVPDQTIEDRKEVVLLAEKFLAARKTWEFTFDGWYVQNDQWLKAEKLRIADAEKASAKRRAEGYDANARGVESLVMPGAKGEAQPLAFEMLTAWENDLDYGPKNGPVPPLWWNVVVGGAGKVALMAWFRRQPVHFARLGANKYGVALDEAAKKVFEVEVGGKGKPSTFWLDPDKKVPYAMFFWEGSDKERVGDAESNLMSTTESANIYYRSASSWKCTIGGESLVVYDDGANGYPCDNEVWDPPLKVATLGEHAGDGTQVPLLDSMRLGKGPRVPYSEFVKLAAGWFHLHRDKETMILRPLNPEYFKTGKVKLTWTGPKPSAPVQLVIQGAGDYKTAFFDLAAGKEVEVPAGSYRVIFGRVLVGKGARAQSAALYEGTSKGFAVEAGKTFDLRMGAPFSLRFDRTGDEVATIDALKILLQEASGCVFTDMHGLGLAPEVLAAKAEDGKGQKVVGKFVHFADAELLNKAAATHPKLGLLCATFPMPQGYKEGAMVLKVQMPGAGWKVGLVVRKHALFGVINSPFK